MRFRSGLIVAATLACTALTANAAPVIFYGADNGVGPGGAHPVSLAAATAFAAAAGSGTVVTFEGLAPVSNPSAVAVGGGATLTTTGNTGGLGGITSANSGTSLGYNTTAGGSQYLQFFPDFNSSGVTATFTFATGVRAFGAYFTGTEDTIPGSVSVLFNDGSALTLPVTENASGGGILFFGFTDVGKSIASVTISESPTAGTRDLFAIDDVEFVNAAAVPEPETLLLGVAALLAMGIARRRR